MSTKSENTFSDSSCGNKSWVYNFIFKTKNLLLRDNTTISKLSNPLTFKEISIRRLMLRLYLAESKLSTYEISKLVTDSSFRLKNLVLESNLTHDLLQRAYELLETTQSQVNKFSKISIDYAYNIINRQNEGYSSELYSAAKNFTMTYKQLRCILQESKTHFQSTWTIIPKQVIENLFSTLKQLLKDYDHFRCLFYHEVHNTIPDNHN